jgi:putative membrane protein
MREAEGHAVHGLGRVVLDAHASAADGAGERARLRLDERRRDHLDGTVRRAARLEPREAHAILDVLPGAARLDAALLAWLSRKTHDDRTKITTWSKSGTTLAATVMAARDFFLPESRKRVGAAVEAIESETSAEVVVTVRKRAGNYSQTDLFVGSVFSLLALMYMLFGAYPFDVGWMPINVMVAFIVGAGMTLEVAALRRMLTPASFLAESTITAAHAAFYELGISRTTGRTGVLVFVAMFERRVEVVPDIAVKPEELGSEWKAAVESLQAALRE